MWLRGGSFSGGHMVSMVPACQPSARMMRARQKPVKKNSRRFWRKTSLCGLPMAADGRITCAREHERAAEQADKKELAAFLAQDVVVRSAEGDRRADHGRQRAEDDESGLGQRRERDSQSSNARVHHPEDVERPRQRVIEVAIVVLGGA